MTKPSARLGPTALQPEDPLETALSAFVSALTRLAPFDLVSGTGRDDTLAGGAGNDLMLGRGGDDALSGGRGDDLLLGNGGTNLLSGGRGDDVLLGGHGRDVLNGDRGRDLLFGGEGADAISGGRGSDVLSGGVGRDAFLFNPARTGEGHDRVLDFTLGEDRIQLDAARVLDSDPGLAAAIVAGGGTVAAVWAALDASASWDLRTAADGDLVIAHPTGTIRLVGVDGAGIDSFADLSGALGVRGLGATLSSLADATGRPATVADVVAASGSGPDGNAADFDLLLAALNAAGLAAALDDPAANLTVFAPTDAAFVSLATRLGFAGGTEGQALTFILGALDTLGDTTELLTDVLTYHVAAGARTLGELNLDRSVETLFGEDVLVLSNRVVDEDPDFANARVTGADVVTGNGVIQVVSEVLLPFDL